MLQGGIGGKGCAFAGWLRPGIDGARDVAAEDRRDDDQGGYPGHCPPKRHGRHSSTIVHNQCANRCATHSLILGSKGLFFHASSRISSDSARSLANTFSISAANSLSRITAFTSSLLEKLQKSMLVEPTVDQAPSMTAVFAC